MTAKVVDREYWAERLQELYDEAKVRHRGQSLPIFGDVLTLMNYLDGFDDVPQGLDLSAECDALACKLRSI